MSENTLITMGLLAKAYTSIEARDRVAQILGEALGLYHLSIATIGDRANLEFQVMLSDKDFEKFGDFWTGHQLHPKAIGGNLLEVIEQFTSEFIDYCRSIDVLNTSEFQQKYENYLKWQDDEA